MTDSNKIFPSDKSEALAMAYIKSLDLSAKTPEEIARLYNETYLAIKEEFKQITDENKRNKRGY